MADGAVFADLEGIADVGVQNASLLNVAARADPDRLIIAAQGRAEPDADVFAQMHVADDVGVGRDPEPPVRRQARRLSFETIDRHQALLAPPYSG